MKKLLKKMLSILCVITILLTTSVTSVLAATHNGPLNSFNAEKFMTMSDAELKAYFVSVGLSKQEAEELLQEKIKLEVYGITTVSTGFPSNPSIGDVYTAEYYVDISDVTSAADVLTALVGVGVPIPIASGIAAAAWVLLSTEAGGGYHGLHVSVDYTYGYTNDGVLGWTPGYQRWNLY